MWTPQPHKIHKDQSWQTRYSGLDWTPPDLHFCAKTWSLIWPSTLWFNIAFSFKWCTKVWCKTSMFVMKNKCCHLKDFLYTLGSAVLTYRWGYLSGHSWCEARLIATVWFHRRNTHMSAFWTPQCHPFLSSYCQPCCHLVWKDLPPPY